MAVARTMEKSGCGVVIKGVDIRRWATISRIAVHLKVGTAMAAELMGACVLTGILDLIFHKCLCAECQPMYEACVRRRTI